MRRPRRARRAGPFRTRSRLLFTCTLHAPFDRGLKGYACSALLALVLDDSGAPRPSARLKRWCIRGKLWHLPFMTPPWCRKCCGPPARAGSPASSSKDVVHNQLEHGGGSRPAFTTCGRCRCYDRGHTSQCIDRKVAKLIEPTPLCPELRTCTACLAPYGPCLLLTL